MTTASDLDDLHSLFASYTFRWQREHDIQNAIETILIAKDLEFVREDPLSPADRPDFMVKRIAVEVKVDGSLSLLTRQIYRYVQNEAVDAVLVVTTRAIHRQIAKAIRGKPVRVLYLNPL